MPIDQTHPSGRPGFDQADSRGISRLVAAGGDPHGAIAAEIGPAYWLYRAAWDKARQFELRLPFPLHVDYELSFRCNLRCPICIMSLPREERNRWGDGGQTLSFQVLRRLLDEGAAKGQAAVGLNGICEPLLTPEIPEIVAYARSVGMLDVMFNTNGLLLDEAVSIRLIEAGLTRLMISLDAATPETYRRIRIGSSYRTVAENVRRFVEIRNGLGRVLPQVRLSFCVTSINEHEIEEFRRQWTGVVDFFSIQQYGNTFEGEFARAREYLFPQHHPYQPGENPRCAQPWKRVMVRHNGDVMPCCDASGLHLVIGNIHQDSLESIWQGQAAETLRQMHRRGDYRDHPICRGCMTKWGPTREGAS